MRWSDCGTQPRGLGAGADKPAHLERPADRRHAGSKIQVRLADRPESRAQVTCDGTALGDLEQGDDLYVEGADVQITLLHPPGYDYYRLLRSKLHWGRGGHGGANGD